MIDFDHNATTSLHPEVAEAMARLQRDRGLHGNPSSVHGRGRRARSLLEDARRRLAGLLNAEALGVTFTSGGTEADNLAVLGLARARRGAGRPDGLLSSPLEHPAVRAAVAQLEKEGHAVREVEVDADGRVGPEAVTRALGPGETGVVSLAWANHELGNVYPVAALCAAAKAADAGVAFHSDAVQALGKVPLDFAASGVDALSISSHKVRGPKGIGALVHRTHLRFAALWAGGHQERGRRTGTEDPIAAAGFALAAELAVADLERRRAHLEGLRRELRRGLAEMPGVRVHGDDVDHTGNTVCATFAGCTGELLMMNLDLEGVYVSTGSACSAGTLDPSPVLLGLGLDAVAARSALRFSLGPDSQADEVRRVLELMAVIVPRVRAVGQLEAPTAEVSA